jgi:hypothetical protein
MLDPIKTAGKSFKSRIMHLTEWEAGMLLIAAVALNVVLIAMWLL